MAQQPITRKKIGQELCIAEMK